MNWHLTHQSLFDAVSLRKGNKSSLMKVFEEGIVNELDICDAVIILDGGFLLHYIHWPKNCTYGDIVQSYNTHVLTKYGKNTTILFYGYPDDSTTKQEEQNRRSSKKLITLIVRVNLAAIEKLNIYSEVVVGSDMDLIVLLTALAPEKKSIYFCKHTGGERPTTVFYQIETIENKLFLFTHVLTGCDTTSCFFGVRKIKAVEIILQLLWKTHSRKELLADGEKFVLRLYGLSKYSHLNEARYYRALKPIVSSKHYAPNDLLYLVSCSCKTGYGNYCRCRKSNLQCSAMCENCSGLSCYNLPGFTSESIGDSPFDLSFGVEHT
ncbi:hypothetical protein PR048_017303 [Dryococelus australis]|uniref:NYN domain-containing protein n=1 Tax=Dryococelus australis TaxID=614101 RepID=A0ABQ9H950_9NEOP|nr:hypothetical protein PR048_017303 [Dryococelus australis]